MTADQVLHLIHLLQNAAGEIRQLGCTCVDDATANRVHTSRRRGNCTGDSQARWYEREANKARGALLRARSKGNYWRLAKSVDEP